MSKKLIALCACPMGLAHTFMAAQALEEAAVEAEPPQAVMPAARARATTAMQIFLSFISMISLVFL